MQRNATFIHLHLAIRPPLLPTFPWLPSARLLSPTPLGQFRAPPVSAEGHTYRSFKKRTCIVLLAPFSCLFISVSVLCV